MTTLLSPYAKILRGQRPVPVATSTGAAVEARALSKRFGSRAVLQDVHLEIARGKSVAIVGRSGCGKSTLLRLLAGLELPDTGGAWIDGTAVRAAAPRLRVMFQEARLLPWKRVLDNVQAGLPRNQRELAAETLEHVGLAGRQRDWPTTLSGGQQQRVALARALAARPDVLLLDEPLGALDALTRLEMQILLERLWLEAGFTLVLVTHDVEEAVLLADEVYVMADGNWATRVTVNLPRPRDRAHPTFIRYREEVRRAILARSDVGGAVGAE